MYSPPRPSRRFIPLARAFFPSSNSRSEQSSGIDWARREREWEEERKDAQREYKEAMDVAKERILQTTFGDLRQGQLPDGLVVDNALSVTLRRQTQYLGTLDFEEQVGELLKVGKSPSAIARGVRTVLDDTKGKLEQAEQLKRERYALGQRQAHPHDLGGEAHRPADLPLQSRLLLLDLDYRIMPIQRTQLELWHFLQTPVNEDRLEAWLERLNERQAERKAARQRREEERREREAAADAEAA
ncbi:hypothetical protein JCM8547_004181 [Rhodosporidiobolus lusitaniae]